jgi:putative ABC transport system permease protein
MRFKHAIQIALEATTIHRGRSALTILGIVIGIGAVMVIMSAGRGAEGLILSELSGFGAEVVVVRPGQEPKGPSDIGATLFSDSLKERDLKALQKKGNVPDLVNVVPALLVPGSVSYGGETYRPTVFGWSAEFMGDMMNLYPAQGVFFDDNDIRNKAKVAVIGSKVKEELFGESDAVGKSLKIKDQSLRVVGVLPERGQTPLFNVNDIVVLPYSTAQTYLLGIDYYHEIMVKTASPDRVQRAVRDIEATLRQTHGIEDPSKDDFFVVTQQGVVDQIKSIIGILTAFLAAVVAVALVVGGIGVMNIMLVSVTERTREIGLRKAIGATNKDIMIQFLLEAIFLTLAGGVIGIVLGALLSFGLAFVLSSVVGLTWEFVFPLGAVWLGLGVAAFVGVLFGLYPARQASQKSPIEALRYE